VGSPGDAGIPSRRLRGKLADATGYPLCSLRQVNTPRAMRPVNVPDTAPPAASFAPCRRGRRGRRTAKIRPYPGRQTSGTGENPRELLRCSSAVQGRFKSTLPRSVRVAFFTTACVAAVVAPAVVNDQEMGKLGVLSVERRSKL
jgi:hypothetical protein